MNDKAGFLGFIIHHLSDFRLARSHPTAPGALQYADALLNIKLQLAERGFKPAHGEIQTMQKPFGSIEIHDHPMREFDRRIGLWRHLRRQSEVQNQLFRQEGHVAKIGVDGGNAAGIHGKLLPLLRGLPGL